MELPGFDGSFFHLKALDAWFDELGIEHIHLQDAVSDSDKTSEALLPRLTSSDASDCIVLLGYSAGCYAVQHLIKSLRNHGVEVDATILLDPAFRSTSNIKDAAPS